MKKIQQSDYKEIFELVSKLLNLPYEVVAKTYKYFWLFIKNNLDSVILNDDLTEEEFKDRIISINVPSLGKFYFDYYKYKHKTERRKIYKNAKHKKD